MRARGYTLDMLPAWAAILFTAAASHGIAPDAPSAEPRPRAASVVTPSVVEWTAHVGTQGAPSDWAGAVRGVVEVQSDSA